MERLGQDTSVKCVIEGRQEAGEKRFMCRNEGQKRADDVKRKARRMLAECLIE